MAKAKTIVPDKFIKGNFVFNAQLGANGMEGLVVSERKVNKGDKSAYYDVCYLGYDGNIIPTAEDDLVETKVAYGIAQQYEKLLK